MIPPLLEPQVVAPLVLVALGALLVLVGEVLLSRTHTFMSRAVTPSYVGVLLAALTTVALGIAGVVAVQQAGWPEPVAFNPGNAMFVADAFSGTVSALLILVALLCCSLAVTYLDELDIHHGEFYALVLFSTAGMLMLVSAVDLLTAYLGVEVMSLPLYVLAGFDRTRLRSNEAGLKYFLLGAVASAILLYGMSLLYGAAGATSYEAIRAAVTPDSPLALAGLGLVVVGLGFKLAIVPFHQWAPDVYEGSPSVVAAFIAVGVTVASSAALLRMTALAFAPFGETLEGLLGWLAILTLLVGSLMSVVQHNVKRLLAYGTLAQVGFLLMGAARGRKRGVRVGGLLAALSHLRPARRLRGGGLPGAPRRGLRGDLGPGGSRGQPARPRRGDDALLLLALGHPDDGGLHGALAGGERSRGERGRGARRAGRSPECDGRLRLPAHPHVDVHARVRRPGAAARVHHARALRDRPLRPGGALPGSRARQPAAHPRMGPAQRGRALPALSARIGGVGHQGEVGRSLGVECGGVEDALAG